MRMIRTAIFMFIILTVLTGVVYPLAVTVVGRVAFGRAADGSFIEKGNQTVGSELIAQRFTDPKYFWPRPSAANYDGANSSGSNLGPTNPALRDAIRDRIAALHAADPENTAPVPADLVTASGSGLDPHLSPEAAIFQVHRISKARGISEQNLRALVDRFTEGRTFGLLGEPRVNVLKLNLALDGD